MPVMIWLAIPVKAIQTDWADFAVPLSLQIINGTLEWYEDSKAADAMAALKQSAAPSANVRRDGKWDSMAARLLGPGDIVKLAFGKNIPAGCQVLAGKPIQVDQFAMTGESLLVTMREGNVAEEGFHVVAGEVDAVVTATGSEGEDRGHDEFSLKRIGTFRKSSGRSLVPPSRVSTLDELYHGWYALCQQLIPRHLGHLRRAVGGLHPHRHAGGVHVDYGAWLSSPGTEERDRIAACCN